MNSLLALSPQQLRRAADLREQIQALEKELSQMLGAPPRDGAAPAPGRRAMSAAAKARIRAAQKARWAKYRTEKGTTPARSTAVRKRKMSPAARARLAAIARERWRKVKAAGRSAL